MLQQILMGAAGDGTGGLAAEFVLALLRTAGKSARERFGRPEQTQALQRVVARAFTAALDAWVITEDEVAHYADLFKEWLFNPAVLSEFRMLLTPSEHRQLDVDLLRLEFDSAGFSADYLGKLSFDVLLQDMVGAFYQAAAAEPILQEPLKIDLLRLMADRMGALDRLLQRQATASEGSVDHLAHIRQLAEEQARGQDRSNELLQDIVQVLTHTSPPYTFFLLNVDMKLNRNWQCLI